MSEDTSAPSGALDPELAKLDPDDPERRFAHILRPLREKHTNIRFWEPEPGVLVVAAKPEKPEEYARLVNQLSMNDEAGVDKNAAMVTFAKACVVHPDRDAAAALFKRLPAFAIAVSGAGQKLSGSGIKELGKG